MSLTNVISLAESARSSGYDYYNSKNFSKAFANFLLALTMNKGWLEDLKESFIRSLSEWSKILESEERYTDLFTCYEEALKIYPQSEVLLNNLGVHLLRLNHYKEASTYFKKSLDLNPLYLPAYRNAENLSNLLIERWHFKMLNDSNRNESYRRAIHCKIDQGFDTILDIGTGSGLLSLYAAEKNTSKIIACDYSEVMTTIASGIIHKNGLSKRVKIINKLSNDLQIPNDVPERVALLITETMDAGLLGEYLLSTLDDAWKRLIINDSNEITKSLRVIPEKATTYLAAIESLELKRKFKYTFSEDDILPFNSDLIVEWIDPYDSIDLKSTNYNLLCKPIKIINFDFNNYKEINNYLNNKNKIISDIICNKSGTLDAFVVWFELFLNEKEIISTSPFSEIDSCWEQAVFPIFKNIDVQQGTKINIEMDTKDGRLNLLNYHLETINFKHKKNHEVSKDFMSFINSKTTINKMNSIYKKIINKNSQISRALDLSIYPQIGLKLLMNNRVELVSFLKNKIDLDFLYNITRMNFDENLYKFLKFEDIYDYIEGGFEFDVVIIDVLDKHGDLDEAWMTLFPLVRKVIRDDGILFPEVITIHYQLVYSEWLENNTKLNNPDLFNQYRGFETINDFKINHFINLNINKLKYIGMSDSIEIAKININNLFTDELQEFIYSTKINQHGFINSILYWFEYGNEVVKISTKSEDFYRNQSANMLKQPIYLNKGDLINVKLNLMSCILKFEVLQT